MKRVGIGFLWAVSGYAIAAFASYFLIEAFSSNTHDRSVEAAMTCLFLLGPPGGIVAFAPGFLRSGKQ
jgi:hypothetical protein